MQETYMGPPPAKKPVEGAQVKVPAAPEVQVPTGKAPEQPVVFEQPHPVPLANEPDIAVTKAIVRLDASKRVFHKPTESYPSETAKWRHLAAPYLRGNGIELATGGDPIRPTSIQFELSEASYARYNNSQPARGVLHWRSDTAIFNLPFKDGVLDYVASSHLLEDIEVERWLPVLTEWVRVLKRPGGRLLVCLPEKKRWEAYLAGGGPPNCAHRHELAYVGELSGYAHKLKLSVICEKFTNVPPGDHNVMFVAEAL